MFMKPYISVVLAACEGERFLKAQLDSLFHQTLPLDELIFFDDASTDQTRAIALSYQKQYPDVMKLYTQNQRIGYIRNFAAAMQKCQGELIFLCDQDDIWKEDKIAIMTEYFQKYPEMLALNTAADYIDAQGNSIQRFAKQKRHPQTRLSSISFTQILRNNISMGCTMAFRKEVKDIYLSKSSYQSAHDWEINMISAMHGQLFYLDQTLISYRIHEANTTGLDDLNKANHLFAKEREKNAKAMADFIQGCFQYQAEMNDRQRKELEKCAQFYYRRYQMLSRHKKLIWFSLIGRLPLYHDIVSWKGMLADAVYAWKKTDDF